MAVTRAFFVLLSVLLAANAPAADIVEGKPTPEMAKKLDALLAANNFQGLHDAIRKPADVQELEESTGWLEGKIKKGGSAYLSLIYSRNKWDMAHHEHDKPHAEQLRFSSYVSVLYLYALMQLDGEKCGDRSAPNSHIAAIAGATSAQLKALAIEPPALQKAVIDQAIAMEKQLAPLRKNDNYICMNETMMGMTPPAGWNAGFLPPEDYAVTQAENQEGMPEHLAQMIARYKKDENN